SGDGSVSTVNQLTQAQSLISYTGASSDSFGGAFISYDDPTTAGLAESINLDALFPTGMVFELRNTSGAVSSVELELTDSSGSTASVRLIGVSGSAQRWKVLSSDFSGINTTQISVITFLFKGQQSGAEILTNWGDFLFQPIAPTSTANLTDFGAQRPTLGIIEPCTILNVDPCPGNTTFNTVPNSSQTSSGNFSFDFNLANGSDLGGRRFAGALMNFSDASYNATGNIVLELRGTGQTSSRVNIILEDEEGDQVIVRVTNLTSTFKKYQITPALIATAGNHSFDLSSIKAIVLLVSDETTGSATASGSIEVNTRGMSYIPSIPTTTGQVTDFSATRPSAGVVEPCAVVGQNPCLGVLDT
ncbi:MAG: hypothetical protein KDA77_23430, partial [Planctomycetaceae bacterium]|nr:hypothetical protein [Planctomycetaceae bacterium]